MKLEIERMSKPLIKKMQAHIEKSRLNDEYNVKFVILSMGALDLYENIVDYYNVKANKTLPKEQRKYIESYKITNAVLSPLVQVGFGLLMLKTKIHNPLSKLLFGKYEKINPSLFKDCKLGLMIFTSVIFATLILKRLILPMFVNPVASYVKDKFPRSYSV
jgi:hypothetical protein